MHINLDPQQGFVKDQKFDLRGAIINAGVKAAVCFKDGKITPEMIRKMESEDQLLLRGINTIFLDHTTPTEHAIVSLEITNIPKILCMILNNEHQYTADERPLRYTEVKLDEYINGEEVAIYNKWVNIFTDVINHKHGDFYRCTNKTEKGALSAMKKMAGENARYLMPVFMPTTLTYSVPFAQINKIALYMEKQINETSTQLDELLKPYFLEFIKQLKDLKVLLTKDELINLCSADMYKKLAIQHPFISTFKGNNDLVFKNNKNISLSLFGEKNPFSGLNYPNEFGVNINYNHGITFAGYAQEQGHRTIDCSLKIPERFNFFLPSLLEDKYNKKLMFEWAKDMIIMSTKYPQGQLIKANMSGSLSNIINFVAKERACEHAQLEIEYLYTHKVIPDIYEGLDDSRQYELADKLSPYVKKLRCQYPTYNCPNPCGHPRFDRDL
ncbi:MAG: FAD-dependent thymidylate synthase [Bacilli bacterium]